MQSDLIRLVPVESQDFPGGESVHTVNARLLHAWLGVGAEFSHWIKRRIDHYGFQIAKDFMVIANPGENPNGGRPTSDYHCTLDMAKELAMVENNSRGRQARRYFIDCEKRLHEHTALNPDNLPTHLETAEALVQVLRDRQRLQIENAELRPKAAVHDAIADASGLMTLQQAGNELGYGRTTLIGKLKAMGIIQRNGQPMRRHIDLGRFEVKPTLICKGGREENYPQVFVTGKGLMWLARLLRVPMQSDLLGSDDRAAPPQLN